MTTEPLPNAYEDLVAAIMSQGLKHSIYVGDRVPACDKMRVMLEVIPTPPRKRPKPAPWALASETQ